MSTTIKTKLTRYIYNINGNKILIKTHVNYNKNKANRLYLQHQWK